MHERPVFPDQMKRLRLADMAARFGRCARGVTSIEYGLIAALGALVAVPALQQMGGKMSGTFGALSASLDGKGPPSASTR